VEKFLDIMWVCFDICMIVGTLWLTVVILRSTWRKLTQ